MSKVVCITGASSGIGEALAKAFLTKGFKVIGTSRSGIINGINNENFIPLKLDLSDLASIHNGHEHFEQLKLDIDILVNNAGIGPDLGMAIPEMDSFESTFAVNVKGTALWTEKLIPFIKKGGKLLNVSSKMGSINHCEQSDSVAYRISKSALNMYSKILANRLEGKIVVAAIHPGWVRTNISKNSVGGRLSSKESADRIMDYIENGFEHGDFWDVEDGVKLAW